jgi:signal-transduction protein with cAMP-binding, CBS, and nucleotidyltransferase domain
MDTLEWILEHKGREVHVIPPEATVLEAVDAMCRAHIGALLVMRGETLVGIFSERDLMTRVVLAPVDPACTCVGEVMTCEVVCVGSHASPHEAMTLMTNNRVRHLPVVDGRRVVGLVSIGDLVQWAISDREHTIDQLQGYVEGRYPG